MTDYVTNQNKVRFPFVPKSESICHKQKNGMIPIQSDVYNSGAYVQKRFLAPRCVTKGPPAPRFTGDEIVSLTEGA